MKLILCDIGSKIGYKMFNKIGIFDGSVDEISDLGCMNSELSKYIKGVKVYNNNLEHLISLILDASILDLSVLEFYELSYEWITTHSSWDVVNGNKYAFCSKLEYTFVGKSKYINIDM